MNKKKDNVKKSKLRKCFCGHFKKNHGTYKNGKKNKNGSIYCCQKDNCDLWNYCNL